MTADDITLYTQPGCGPCVGLKRSLESHGIPFTLRDITTDPAAHARVVELGYTGTPVLEHPGGHFKGVDIDKVEQLALALF